MQIGRPITQTKMSHQKENKTETSQVASRNDSPTAPQHKRKHRFIDVTHNPLGELVELDLAGDRLRQQVSRILVRATPQQLHLLLPYQITHRKRVQLEAKVKELQGAPSG